MSALIKGSMNLPAYTDIAATMAQTAAVHSPAEAHGMSCALLARDVATAGDRLLKLIYGDEVDVDDPALKPLLDLFESTRVQMQDPVLGLALLLPDDETPLDERFQAAGEWASGFLYGWLRSGQPDKGNASPEIDEFMADCKLLATTRYEVDEAEEDAETVYLELSEYLRMGALLVQEETQPIKAAPRVH